MPSFTFRAGASSLVAPILQVINARARKICLICLDMRDYDTTESNLQKVTLHAVLVTAYDTLKRVETGRVESFGLSGSSGSVTFCPGQVSLTRFIKINIRV